MTSHRFPSLERMASELTTRVVEQNALTWDALVQRMNAYLDWEVLPRATEMRCGAGVPDYLKRVLPTVKDAASPFGIAPYFGVRIVETDDLPAGRYAVMDQYGYSMFEGEVPV